MDALYWMAVVLIMESCQTTGESVSWMVPRSTAAPATIICLKRKVSHSIRDTFSKKDELWVILKAGKGSGVYAAAVGGAVGGEQGLATGKGGSDVGIEAELEGHSGLLAC